MHLRKLLIAVVVVGALCALAWWRARLEPSSSEPAERPLLEGFDRSRVRALRVDNVERSLQLRIERNARDEWNIVDPLEFPAENAVVQVLWTAEDLPWMGHAAHVELHRVRVQTCSRDHS